jgi:hypothetical protein
LAERSQHERGKCPAPAKRQQIGTWAAALVLHERCVTFHERDQHVFIKKTQQQQHEYTRGFPYSSFKIDKNVFVSNSPALLV